MNCLESVWLGERLAAIPDGELFPLLNVGSSTLEFRTQTQPYIESNIFDPLRRRGGKVYHLDVKAAPGVDIVGNLLDPGFLEQVSRMMVRSIMVSNLLEHVENRREICDVLMKILPAGGYLFVSGPHDYPFHADPIDTMFRPTIGEVAAHFPGTCVVESAIIDSGNWREWSAAERGRPLRRALARLLVPFYRPKKWLELARQTPYIFKHIKAYAVVLQKQPAVKANEAAAKKPDDFARVA
jgi:hypothetical protein